MSERFTASERPERPESPRNAGTASVRYSPKARRFVDLAVEHLRRSPGGPAVEAQALLHEIFATMARAAGGPGDEDALSDAVNDVLYLEAIRADLTDSLRSRRGPAPTSSDAAVVKAMLAHGFRQSDIAAYFGVNSGRISEINTGRRFAGVGPSPEALLAEIG